MENKTPTTRTHNFSFFNVGKIPLLPSYPRVNFITNLFSYGPQGLLGHKWLGDTQSGFRAFRGPSLERLNLEGRRYEIEGELCFEAAAKRLKVKEVPITISHWVRGVNTKDGLRNGLFVIKKCFKL